jgi:2-polyprenyl-3-methyl-5-hydroxy-6-metoxy-1,4-benzoquinol methylase
MSQNHKIVTSFDQIKNNSIIYLDSLQNSLLGLINQDPPFSRFGSIEFDITSRINGLDWPTQAYTMIGLKRLYNSRILAETIIEKNVKGDFFEAGVWRGGASIMMRGVLSAYGITDRCVWLADSFEGLPSPDESSYPQDAGSLLHTYPELSVSMEQVQENFRKFNLLDEQVVFLKGWFKDTLYNSSVQTISLLRLDGDLYESTIQSLEALYDKVSDNGYIIIDDYHCIPQCKQAVLDFFKKRDISPTLNEIDGVGIYWKKISFFSNNQTSEILSDSTQKELHPGPEPGVQTKRDNDNFQAIIFQQMTNLYVQLAERDAQLMERNTQLTESSTQLAERDAQLVESNTQLAERDNQLAESSTQLAERDAQLAEIKTQLTERDAQLTEIKTQLAERDNQLAESNKQLSEREAQLSERDAQLSESNTQLSEREAQLSERDAQLAERDAQLAESNKQLSERDAQLSERDAQLAESNKQLADRDVQLSKRDAQLSESNTQLSEREALIQELMKSIASIYKSNSWRITSPLRFVGNLWRLVFMRHNKIVSLQDNEQKNGQPDSINQEHPSKNRTFSQTRRKRDWHAWRGKIKYRLAAYPSVYETVNKIYHLVFRSNPVIVPAPEKNGFSRQHISKAQGLVDITDTESGEIIHPAQSFLAHYEEDRDFSDHVTDIKAIAYYLPQFHTIPENDKWWGDGFTEWANTRKTKPLFPGHYQPREPHDDIGYYDLSDIEVIKKQVELAKKHGIYGFCFYHYWFHGKRLLGKPIDLLLNHPEIDMPFCFCWANETWSKKWDGRDHHILMEQTFSPEDDLHFISFLKPYMMDSRYIRVDGKPMLLVYRISKFPKPLSTAKRWRKWCWENGVGEIHLVAVGHGEVFPHMPLGEVGFDAYAAFPPHNFSCQHISSEEDIFGAGYRFDYASGVESYSFSEEVATIYEGCTLGWDNTPRFGKNANIYMNFSLDRYGSWLRRAMEYTRTRFKPDERYLFINAWNEWAEGTYLEPDKKYGYSYINTTSRGLLGISDTGTVGGSDSRPLDSADRYTQDYEWLKSLIESRGEHALAKVTQFIKPDSEILEFGPSSGYFTRFLREERNAIIDIVELDRTCAERAARCARDSYVGDIEQGRWKDVYAGRRYDVILFADVLEHLRDPWCVLREVAEFVRKDGRIILSVPNIAHAQILSSLYNDDFSYAQFGILDKTHLRFFTEQTVRQMVEDCGLQVCELIPVNAKILPEGCGTLWNHADVPVELKKMLSSKPNAHAIQFVLCCTPKGDGINERGLHASSIE